MNYVHSFLATFTDAEAISLVLALKSSLAVHKAQGYNIDTAPADSTIGAQRDVLAGLEAIRLGNRRGSDKYQIKMVPATAITIVG
jgi:hypothetical protein